MLPNTNFVCFCDFFSDLQKKCWKLEIPGFLRVISHNIFLVFFPGFLINWCTGSKQQAIDNNDSVPKLPIIDTYFCLNRAYISCLQRYMFTKLSEILCLI